MEFEEVYDKYFDQIFNFILKRVLDVELAEDLAGEVFMKVFENFNNYNPDKASIKTWIYSITNNRLIDYYRTKKHKKSFEKVKPFIKDQDVLKEIQQKRLKMQKNKLYKDILKILDEKLSFEEKNIIISHYVEDKSYKEISEITDIKTTTLRSKVYRALKKIKKYINLKERGII